jgi:hypothetical protein
LEGQAPAEKAFLQFKANLGDCPIWSPQFTSLHRSADPPHPHGRPLLGPR